jgi:SET domain-containing protein
MRFCFNPSQENDDVLLVSASVKPSPIHGLGCFTNEPISKGQVVWQFDPRLDRAIPEAVVLALPAAAQEYLRIYAYLEIRNEQRVYTLCGDHAKHMNHSNAANLLSVDSNLDTALRDIAAGEELTCNYYEIDLDGSEKLGPSANPPK